MVNKEIDVRSRPCILPGLVFPVDTAGTKHEACRRRRWRRSCPARVRTFPLLFAQALSELRALTVLSVARRARKGRGQGGGGAAAAEVRACGGRGPGGSLLIEASFCCLPSADSTSPTEVRTRRAIDDAIRDSIPDTRTHCHEITAVQIICFRQQPAPDRRQFPPATAPSVATPSAQPWTAWLSWACCCR